MPIKQHVIFCITGACGNIAFSLYGMLFNSQPFGPDVNIHVRLLDIPAKIDHLKALKMQLEDCCFNNVSKIQITDKEAQAFNDADVVLFMGSQPRRPGMDKNQYFQLNAKIFSRQGKILNESAKKTCKSIVVANPVNTNCLILAKNAPSIPSNNFTALIRLDYNRLTSQLARVFEVPLKAIKNHIIWGNHSINQFRDLSLLEVENIDHQVIIKKLKEIDVNQIAKSIGDRNSMILDITGSSTFISAAKAIMDHLKDLFYGSQKIASKGVILKKSQYGVDADFCFSMPVVCLGNGEYRIVDDLTLNEHQKTRIIQCFQEMKQQKQIVHQFLPRQQ